DVIWGLNFKRFIRRKNEEDLWSAYRRIFGITAVSEAGDLRGIQDIGSVRLFTVKPYGLSRYDKQAGQAPLFPLTGGVDIKYGVTSNLVLNLTGNTDFADAEVDLQPFNLTPFKVFIPEKRQFFLENAGIFNFAIGGDQLFFSRQIGIDPITGQQVPINGGAILTGASDAGASLSYRSNWLDGIVARRKIGPNFNPEVGFIQRTDSNETSGELTFKVRPKINGVREVQFGGFILHAPDTHNVVQTQEWY